MVYVKKVKVQKALPEYQQIKDRVRELVPVFTKSAEDTNLASQIRRTHTKPQKKVYVSQLQFQEGEAYRFHEHQVKKADFVARVGYPKIKGYKPMTQDTYDQLVDAGFLG